MEEHPSITFEFVGGPHDGRVVSGMLGDDDDAERCYQRTNYGTVGFLFKVASEYAVELLMSEGLDEAKRHCVQRHFYVVAVRLEDESEVYVRAEYAPEATGVEQHSS